MKAMKRVFSVLITLCVLLFLFSGCSSSNFHINETIKKYYNLSSEEEKAILDFAEKYEKFHEQLREAEQTKDLDTWARLSVEMLDDYRTLQETYLDSIAAEIRSSLKQYNSDGKESEEIGLLALDMLGVDICCTNLSGDCRNYELNGKSEGAVEDMVGSAEELFVSFLDVFTQEGSELWLSEHGTID